MSDATSFEYPLQWPQGWPRTPDENRRGSRFRTSLGRARDDLIEELERFCALDVVVYTDVPTRIDGKFYATAREPDDPGIAVYFNWRGKPYQIACDSYESLQENVRALHKTVEAWRTIERHGASQLLERVVSGFSALPPGADGEPEEPQEPWWDVFEIGSLGGATPQEVSQDPHHPMRAPILKLAEMVYKTKIKKAHPDLGGDAAESRRLNAALAQAREVLSGGES